MTNLHASIHDDLRERLIAAQLKAFGRGFPQAGGFIIIEL
jgi:hypothetical protein